MVIAFFVVGLIIFGAKIRRKGIDPHGTSEGYSILAKLSSITIFIWLGILITYLIAQELLVIFWTIPIVSNDLFTLLGAIIGIIGFVIEVLGMGSLGENFRLELPKEETELITTGIYRVTRNPIVLGLDLIILATFFFIPNLLTLIITILNFITFDAKVRCEEIFLHERFGESYDEYKKKVGRYLPFPVIK